VNDRNSPSPGSQGNEASSLSSGSLRRLRDQDQDAWRRLVATFIPLVYSWCLRAGLQSDDSADVVQEVFRTVAARLTDFQRERPGDSFRAWLKAITRNKLGDYFRRQKTEFRAHGGSDALDTLLQVPQIDDAEDESPEDFSGLCHRALANLKVEFQETTWQAFWRVVIEDRPPADVAAELGLTMNAVYLAKSRILRRLREELGERDDDGPANTSSQS
jgi:RNA polymerase sigma-70 factor, ECF subfamily